MNWLQSRRCIKVQIGKVTNKDDEGNDLETYAEEHDGEEKRFYGASFPVLMDVRPVIVGLVEKGLRLDTERQDLVGSQRSTQRRGVKRNAEGLEVSVELETQDFTSAPMDIGIFTELRTSRREGIKSLLEAVAEDNIVEAFAKLVVSSMRDDFKPEDNGRPSDKDVKAFIAGADIETFADCVTAALDINKRALFKGFRIPLLKKIEAKWKSLVEEGTETTETMELPEIETEEKPSSTETTSKPSEHSSSPEVSTSDGS